MILKFVPIFMLGATLTLPATAKDLSPKQREEMAAAHEKMATCLRSKKPLEECRKEMKDSDQCPMMKDKMGKMHEGHGMDKSDDTE